MPWNGKLCHTPFEGKYFSCPAPSWTPKYFTSPSCIVHAITFVHVPPPQEYSTTLLLSPIEDHLFSWTISNLFMSLFYTPNCNFWQIPKQGLHVVQHSSLHDTGNNVFFQYMFDWDIISSIKIWDIISSIKICSYKLHGYSKYCIIPNLF